MKTSAKIPQIPQNAFYTLDFPDNRFYCVIVPYNARAAATLRRKAKEAGLSLGEYLCDEVLSDLTLGKPEDGVPQKC
jgi:hypothetical protein